MRRFLKCSLVAVGVLSMLLAAVLLVEEWFLATAVKDALVQRLKVGGLSRAVLSVQDIGTGRAHLTDLALGQTQRLTIDSAVATYDTADLRAGRLRSLRLSGARLRVSMEDGGIDLGELSRLLKRPEGAEAEPLFFQRVELHSSTVLVERNGRRVLRLPVSGTLRRMAADRLSVRLNVGLLDRELRLAGELELGGDRIVLDEGRLTLPPGDIRLSGTAAVLREARATVDVTGTFQDGRGELRVLPGSSVEARSFIGALGGVEARPSAPDAEEPWLHGEVAGAPVVLRFQRDGGGGPNAGRRWSVRWPELRFRMGRTDVRVPGRDLRLRGLRAELGLRGRAGPNGGRVALVDAATAAMESAELRETPGGWRTGPMTWRARPVGDGSLLQWHRGEAGRRLDLAVAAGFEEAVRIEGGSGLSGTIGSMALHAEGGWEPGSAPALDARLILKEGAVRHEAADLEVTAIQASVPVTVNAAAEAEEAESAPPADHESVERTAGRASGDPEPGTFETGKVRLGSGTLPGLSGEVAVQDGRPRLSGRWPVLEEAELRFEAGMEDGEPRLSARLPRTELSDARALSRAFPALEGVRVAGVFALEAEAASGEVGEFVPRVRLDFADMRLMSEQHEAAASGVTGTIHLAGVDPLRTPGGQTITLDEATLGEVKIRNGRLAFRLEDRDTLFIERMKGVFGGGGRFRIHAFELNRENPRVRTDLFFEGLDLGHWMSELAGERVEATGQLYGRVPIVFQPEATRKLTFGAGYLHSMPGQEGTIRIRDPDLAAALLQRADPRIENQAGVRQEVQERIVEALTDFRYSMLSFDLDRQAEEGVRLRIRTRGIGRQGRQRIPVGRLVVNVHNFGRLVNQAVRARLRAERATDRALDRVFETSSP